MPKGTSFQPSTFPELSPWHWSSKSSTVLETVVQYAPLSAASGLSMFLAVQPCQLKRRRNSAPLFSGRAQGSHLNAALIFIPLAHGSDLGSTNTVRVKNACSWKRSKVSCTSNYFLIKYSSVASCGTAPAATQGRVQSCPPILDTGGCSGWHSEVVGKANRRMQFKVGDYMQHSCANRHPQSFFSCIADRVRDIVGQQLEIRKNKTRIECRIFTGKTQQPKNTNKHKRHPNNTPANKQNKTPRPMKIRKIMWNKVKHPAPPLSPSMHLFHQVVILQAIHVKFRCPACQYLRYLAQAGLSHQARVDDAWAGKCPLWSATSLHNVP